MVGRQSISISIYIYFNAFTQQPFWCVSTSTFDSLNRLKYAKCLVYSVYACASLNAMPLNSIHECMKKENQSLQKAHSLTTFCLIACGSGVIYPTSWVRNNINFQYLLGAMIGHSL